MADVSVLADNPGARLAVSRADVAAAMTGLRQALLDIEAEAGGPKSIGRLSAVVVARVRFDLALNSYLSELGLARR